MANPKTFQEFLHGLYTRKQQLKALESYMARKEQSNRLRYQDRKRENKRHGTKTPMWERQLGEMELIMGDSE